MCAPVELLSTYFNLPQYNVDPVCAPIELLSTYFDELLEINDMLLEQALRWQEAKAFVMFYHTISVVGGPRANFALSSLWPG